MPVIVPKVWTAPKKAGMRVAKTGLAGVLAYATVKIVALWKPELDTVENVIILTTVYTGIWTWFKNRKKK